MQRIIGGEILCQVPGCLEPPWSFVNGQGVGYTHRWCERHLDLSSRRPNLSPAELDYARRSYVLERITVAGECWLWDRHLLEDGYGQCEPPAWLEVHQWRAHRLAYEVWKGPIREGHDVHHKCGVRPCVNPTHLESIDHRSHGHLHGGTTDVSRVVRMSHLKWESEPDWVREQMG